MSPKEKWLVSTSSSGDDTPRCPSPSNCDNNDDDDDDATLTSKSATVAGSLSVSLLPPRGDTRVFETADGAPFVICNSPDPFVNPTTPATCSPEQINETLNLTLGVSWLSYRSATSPFVLWVIAVLDRWLLAWWEPLWFWIWAECVPLTFKRRLTFPLWHAYLAIHRRLLYKSTGLHPSASVEYHALTTLLWWGQFFVITPRRIRFSLGQLSVVSPVEIPDRVYRKWVSSNQRDYLQQRHPPIPIPESQRDHCTVQGLYIDCRNVDNVMETQPRPKRILFWIYGGAYLGGDCHGNASPAFEFAKDCQMDGVFIPHFRLAPEATIDDVLWDVCLAYHWVCRELLPVDGEIVLVGLSSGAAIGLRLMQFISERSQTPKVPLLPSFLEPLMDSCNSHENTTRKTVMQQPQAALLFAPYVDYTEPKKGSFLHYAKHDLIVSEAVQEYGLPYLNGFIPKVGPDHEVNQMNATGRYQYSPVNRSMKGLPPMCLVVSEHEATYDMTIQVVNKARAAGADVTVGVWKYMCHVFSFLQAFVPEGELSIEFSKEWIRQQCCKTEK